MTIRRRPRVAIAVEPPILADALAAVLQHADVDEVIDLRTQGDAGRLDAALVTRTTSAPAPVDADVVIELPDDASDTVAVAVRVCGQSASVTVACLDDVLRLLDDYCPGRDRRA